MRKIKFIKRQDSGYKLSSGNSGETSLNLSNEIFVFVSQGSIMPGEERDITFRVYKEDFIKAMSFIIMKLPLYKTSSTFSKKVDDFLKTFSELYSKIDVFFANKNVSEYKVNLYYRNDGRIYLRNLRDNGFSVRDYLVENYSALQFDDEGENFLNLRVLSDIEDRGEETFDFNSQLEILDDNYPLQQIFYGAPGTGKSNTIKKQVEDAGKPHVRTTFHPDSDYSTFVGAYKPSMSSSSKIQRFNLSVEDLAEKLGALYNDAQLGSIGGIQTFCLNYYPYIDGEYMSVNVKKLLELAGVPSSYSVEITKYLKFCRMMPQPEDKKIVYEFVPQAFLKAYTGAWKNQDEPFFLIIEEINRGNCAQIFGDLFQLLDRNEDGMSEYPISPDEDIQKFLLTDKKYGFAELTDEQKEAIPADVQSGKLMTLPKNLHIWATMNTSDQSLFPIDSAFKRRWDWKYIPIVEGRKKSGEPQNWSINADTRVFDWWSFISIINKEIHDATESEDKKLGYYFCKAKKGVIDAETFVSKVIFYLWNDVFKDIAASKEFFKDKDNNPISYDRFYDCDSKGNIIVQKDLVEIFLKKLKVKELGDIEDDDDSESETVNQQARAKERFSLNGEGRYGKARIALEALKYYVNNHESASASDVVEAWSNLGISSLIETSAAHEERESRSTDAKMSGKWNELRMPKGEYIYITNQYPNDRINVFMNAVNAQSWGIRIERLAE